jgi:hypothetical protein
MSAALIVAALRLVLNDVNLFCPPFVTTVPLTAAPLMVWSADRRIRSVVD